jgi:hypothetical protein
LSIYGNIQIHNPTNVYIKTLNHINFEVSSLAENGQKVQKTPEKPARKTLDGDIRPKLKVQLGLAGETVGEGLALLRDEAR